MFRYALSWSASIANECLEGMEANRSGCPELVTENSALRIVADH